MLKNHLARKIDAAIDFEFIREWIAPLYYHNNGRPAIDPVKLIKMMLLDYLSGIPSAYLEELEKSVDEDQATTGKKPEASPSLDD